MKSNLAILSSYQKSIDFIKKNKLSSTLNLYANSSRNIEVAQIFAETHNFKKYYGAYEDLIKDKSVDFVLNFLPSGIKFEYIYLCLKNNIKVIIAGAGGAAHLPGMVASLTKIPVLGVPIESKLMNGLDSLLSIVQMPKGIPVGSVAIGEDGAMNAGLYAASIIALTNKEIKKNLKNYRSKQSKAVKQKP